MYYRKRMFIFITIMSGLAVILFSRNKSYITKKIYGETFALIGTETKSFLYMPKKVDRVYGYNSNGEIILYEEGKDYEVDYKDGTIKRLDRSSIPDYSLHKVNYEGNKFIFTNESIRNPELNIEYQIFIDYEYNLEKKSIPSKSECLSEEVRSKLILGKAIKISLIGDSIAAGAQTTAEYYENNNIDCTFLGYLKNELENIYGCDVTVELCAEGGVSSEYLNEHIDDIIAGNPDIVFIEFGMNDHLNASKENSDYFDKTIRVAVSRLKEEKIDVAIVGFFQQNTEWILEREEDTIFYNYLLQKIALDENIYFADIYKAFEEIAKIKNIYEDLTSDYMHHPTDFGHQIYLSCILPLIIMDDESVSVNQSAYYLDILN